MDLLSLVGNTPLLRIRLFEKTRPRLEVYAKAEWFNPGGSVKDRAALAMVEAAERSGALTPDKVLIDSTSGNTGIALAWIAAAKGYRLKLVMPENVTRERKEIVRALGAEVIYSPGLEGSDGAIEVCREIVSREPDRFVYVDQYSNAANPLTHYEHTGVEILQQTAARVTHFVAGVGTTGTLVGVSRRLKEHHPSIRTYGVMPDNSLHGLEGLKFLPAALVPPIWQPDCADEVWQCPTEEAYRLASEVARSEGMLVGHSCGAALWGVQRLAETIDEGVVVTVFPDSGTRYLSSGLYGQAAR